MPPRGNLVIAKIIQANPQVFINWIRDNDHHKHEMPDGKYVDNLSIYLDEVLQGNSDKWVFWVHYLLTKDSKRWQDEASDDIPF